MRWKAAVPGTLRVIPILAMGVAAYVFGPPGIVLLVGYAIAYRIDVRVAQERALFWRNHATEINDKLDQIMKHATAPSPEEELLADVRRRMLLQWREEGFE